LAPGLISNIAGEQALFVSATGEPALGVPIIIRFAISFVSVISRNTLASSPPLLWPTMFIF
jgi:hypothetical protein